MDELLLVGNNSRIRSFHSQPSGGLALEFRMIPGTVPLPPLGGGTHGGCFVASFDVGYEDMERTMNAHPVHRVLEIPETCGIHRHSMLERLDAFHTGPFFKESYPSARWWQ